MTAGKYLTFYSDYLATTVSEAVDIGLGRRPSTSSRGRKRLRIERHPKFSAFITNVIEKASITMPVILTSLVYLERSKPHLYIGVNEWALERVFLGALIVASKVSLICPSNRSITESIFVSST